MPFEKGGAKTAPKKAAKKEVSQDAEAFVIDPSIIYEFVLTGGVVTPSFTVPREIDVWDEDEKRVRTIRYSSTATSPFKDEQDEKVPSEGDIEFVRGRLFVSGVKAPLIEFLLKHDWLAGKAIINPDNLRNRGVFKLIDRNEGVIASLDLKKSISKATTIIDEASADELKVFMLSAFNFNADDLKDVSKKAEAIQLEAYKRAELNPTVFIDKFKDKSHQYKAVFLEALKAGILDDQVDGLVSRTETGTVVLQFDPEETLRASDALTEWAVSSIEGKALYSELEKIIDAGKE